MLLNHDQYKTTNNLEKLLEYEDLKNTAIIAAVILLTISMYIGPSRLLEFRSPNVEYHLVKRQLGVATSVDWSDNGEIEEAIAVVGDDKDDDEEDPRDQARQLSKEKQQLKQAVAKTRTCQ